MPFASFLLLPPGESVLPGKRAAVIFFMEKSAFFILFSEISLCKRHTGDYIIH